MKRTLIVIAALTAFAVVAEEETETAEAAETTAVQTNSAVSVKAFTTLPLSRHVEGAVSVRRPNGDWEPVEEGLFYPLGSYFRAEKGGLLVLAFGSGSAVTILSGAEFGTRALPIGKPFRTLVLVNGTIALRLPDNLPEGAFFITAPGFTVKNPAGESVITYENKGDGDVATILCKTGSLGIEGRHFDIPAMRAADEIRIRTSKDLLFTSLYGTSGNYVVNLDQGMCTHEEFGEDGSLKSVVEKGTLAWHLSPRTQAIINRSVPALGERMSVHTMTFDAAGGLKNERAFSEGRAEVNSGELVPQEKTDADELAKRAAEMTETTAATDVEEAPAEGAAAKSEESTSTEE